MDPTGEQLRPGVHFEMLEDGFGVLIDRVTGDVKSHADLFIRVALQHTRQNLLASRRQIGGGLIRETRERASQVFADAQGERLDHRA